MNKKFLNQAFRVFVWALMTLQISSLNLVWASKSGSKKGPSEVTCGEFLTDNYQVLMRGKSLMGIGDPRLQSRWNDTDIRIFAGVRSGSEAHRPFVQLLKKQKVKYEFSQDGERKGLFLEGPVSKLDPILKHSDVMTFRVGDSISGAKELGTEILLADAVGPIVKTGYRYVDFRMGKRDWHPGRAHFKLRESGEIIPILISDVSVHKTKDLDPLWMDNQGVRTPEEVVEFMSAYYPGVNLESELTVIQFERR
jgi:hypothetical protein